MERYSLLLLSCIIAATISSSFEKSTWGHNITTQTHSDYVVGQYLSLFCQGIYNFNKIDMIEWKKDGVGISWFSVPTNTFLYNPNVKGVHLTLRKDYILSIVLKNVDLETSGNYTCGVIGRKNTTGVTDQSKPFEIIVNKDLENMSAKVMTRKVSNIGSNVILAGEPMILQCVHRIYQSEVESVTWMKNGEEFITYHAKEKNYSKGSSVEGVNVKLEKSENGNIFLEKTYQNTTGNITCTVKSNKKTQSGSRLVVLNNVKERLGIHYSITIDKSNVGGIEEAEKYEMRCNSTIQDNESLKQILWYKDDVLFYRKITGERPEFSTFGINGLQNLQMVSELKFKIDYVTPAAAGGYKCELIYEVTGEAKAKYNLAAGQNFVSKIGFHKINVKPIKNKDTVIIPFYSK